MDILSEKTNRMPGLFFDPAEHSLTLDGEAYPEDVTASFEPIMTSIAGLIDSADNSVSIVNFRLLYFNSGSARKVLEIIKLIDAAKTSQQINWYADEEDDEMIGHGNRFAKVVTNAKFTIIEEE